MGKTFEQTLYSGDVCIAGKHMKRYQTLMFIRKVQIVNTVRYIETEKGLIRQKAGEIEFIGEYS